MVLGALCSDGQCKASQCDLITGMVQQMPFIHQGDRISCRPKLPKDIAAANSRHGIQDLTRKKSGLEKLHTTVRAHTIKIKISIDVLIYL